MVGMKPLRIDDRGLRVEFNLNPAARAYIITTSGTGTVKASGYRFGESTRGTPAVCSFDGPA